MSEPDMTDERISDLAFDAAYKQTQDFQSLPFGAVRLTTTYDGMSLRDHFAGLAMQGLLAASEPYQTAELAKYAYAVADAMIKERTK